MTFSSMIRARPIAARPISSRHTVSGRQVYRIADIGDSTSALGHGTRFSSVAFSGRSDDTGHAADDEGTLTIYSNGTAKWAADGDTAGAVVAVGTGLQWLESGTANKGFAFIIVAEDVAAASPSGTDHAIAVSGGSVSGSIGWSANTMFVWAQILSGFQLEITGIQGHGGKMSADILAALPNIFTRDSHGKAIATMPDIVHVSCGINDCADLVSETPTTTIGSVLANLTSIKNYIVAQGAKAVFSTLSHEAPGALREYMDDVNDHIAAMAAANPSHVFVADYKSVIDDSGDPDDAALAGMMSGPHYGGASGALVAASKLLTILDVAAGTRQGRSTYRGEKPSLAAGADYVGSLTAGAASTATGTSEWDVWAGIYGVDVGDVDVVLSMETVADERHQWQVVTVTGGAEDAPIVLLKPLSTLPSVVRAEVEIYIDDTSKLGGGLLPGPRFAFIFFDGIGGVMETDHGCLMQCGGHDQELACLLKTEPVTPPVGAVSAMIAVSWMQLAGNDVVVKLRNAGAEAA